MRLLFPSDYFNPKQVDEAYLDQADRLRDAGFEVSVMALDDLATGSSRVLPWPASGETVVYRGWMITPDDYARLVVGLSQAGAVSLTSVE